MATLTITNIRALHRNVATASSLDDIRPARSRSPFAATDRQTDPRTSTPRATYHSCLGDRYNCRPECEAVANGTYLSLMGSRDNWPVSRGAGQPTGRDNWRPT